MSLPHLHLYHPAHTVHGSILAWIADVEEVLRSEAAWRMCQLSRVAYTDQGSFHVGTEVDRVRRMPGPVIFLQNVQRAPFERFRGILGREFAVYTILPSSSADILEACEEARRGYEDGEPRIPIRELIAYLIVAKLARMDKWGGTATNKAFLWASDLPKGGFPKDIVDSERLPSASGLHADLKLLRARRASRTLRTRTHRAARRLDRPR